jgi:hypothetical protein
MWPLPILAAVLMLDEFAFSGEWDAILSLRYHGYEKDHRWLLISKCVSWMWKLGENWAREDVWVPFVWGVQWFIFLEITIPYLAKLPSIFAHESGHAENGSWIFSAILNFLFKVWQPVYQQEVESNEILETHPNCGSQDENLTDFA